VIAGLGPAICLDSGANLRDRLVARPQYLVARNAADMQQSVTKSDL
jgi:hypothetical protein